MVENNYKGLEMVVPDDCPPILSDSVALLQIRANSPLPIKIYNDRVGDEQSLILRIRKAHTLICMNSATKLRNSVIESCPSLRHIALWGKTTEHVDLNVAAHMGITVTYAPGSYTDTVAEHALAMALALARRLPELNERVRLGEWPGGMVIQLTGKVMGIVGDGSIGRRMAEISSGIGMKVIMAQRENGGYSSDNLHAGQVNRVGLETLLREADVVSLHTRPGDSAQRMFGRKEFATMKSTALFINTASNRLVDEYALASALRSETIAGAALDVFDNEPLGRRNPLASLPNLIFTPHIASHTSETVSKSLGILTTNVLGFLDGRIENQVID